MKVSKFFLIAQALVMYTSTAFFIIAFVMALIENPDLSDTIGLMSLLMFIFEMVALAVAVLSCCFSLFALFGDVKNPAKTTMIVKLVLIPWYALNFLKWSAYVMGMLNPFLMIGIPVVIALGVGLTYVLMLGTSSHNIFFIIRAMMSRRSKVVLVFSLIFHFLFILDVVGSIMLYAEDKKKSQVID